ncbi:unnamed protein product [Angiostrongylus costaricensis]|uniref:EGF-like domain-containing protein n=1 Tax=Angiostrongylus costaricensis TaxID=334426 RepID=A0A3P7HCQ3_ANGCS|nr:unnamed protein product [Angiostrongylus costaricensis]
MEPAHQASHFSRFRKLQFLGIRHQICDNSQSNNSLTHATNSKKFLVEVEWTTDRDVGSVQFMLTVAVENGLYWERWRPRNGFLRPKSAPRVQLVEWLFEIEVEPGPVFIAQTMAESPPDNANTTGVSPRLFRKFSPSRRDHLREDDLRFLNSHVQRRQQDFVEAKVDPEETAFWFRKKAHRKIGAIFDIPNLFSNFFLVSCKQDQFSVNGECIMKDDGRIECRCNTGFTGSRCEREIDECQMKNCKNWVRCIDKVNDYECVCGDGWVGKNCDRPCQDIYGSCRIWKREGQCEAINATIFNRFSVFRPLKLLSRAFPHSVLFAGYIWLNLGFYGGAIDFPSVFNATAYNETLIFSVIKPLVFGTPSIGYTVAVNNDDPSDIHICNGFLTIRQYSPKDETTMKVALMSASRSFKRKGTRLVQTITKEQNGRQIKFKKIYNQIQQFESL